MKEIQYFLNKGNSCSPKLPIRFTEYLNKNNYLSEFNTENSKQQVLDNLGVLDKLKILKDLIDAKVITSGNIPWDLSPTEGNTEHVLSSDAIYQTLNNEYYSKEDINHLFEQLFSAFINSDYSIDFNVYERLNALEAKVDKIKHVFLTQEEYDALESYDEDTLYFILESKENTNWVFGDSFPCVFS